MPDIATIGIAVDSREVRKADGDLNKFSKTGKQVERSADNMAAGFKRMAASLAGIVSISAIGSKLVSTARKFDVMNASLVTITGSTEAAAQAFDALQAFAKETPFSLDEVTGAFVKMGALGLDPSREALISYGNTASAMGKSLDQLVEAVADAATGEFERLKEFGIKSSQEGDKVSFTFKGITTTVGKNSEEIQKYLKNIGDTDFAGAMERRAKSLDGALSNLEVSWDQLFLTISQQGTGDLIRESVLKATEAIEELDVFIASGALSQHIDAIGTQFFETGEDITAAINAITKILNAAGIDWGDAGGTAADFIIDAFGNMPANIRAFIQIVVTELAVLVDKGIAVGIELGEALNPLNWFEEADALTLAKRFEAIEMARQGSIVAIIDESNAIKERAATERSASVISFEAEKLRRAARTGELPSLPGSGKEKGPTQAELKARAKREEALKKSEDALKDWLELAELELTLSGKSAEQKERAIKLWELEKKGIDLTSSAYADLSDRLDSIYSERESQRLFLEEQEKLAEKQKKIWEDTVGQIQGHFSDGFFNIMQGNFDSLGDGFKAMLDRMIADALAAQLTQSLFGSQTSPTQLGGFLAGGGGLFGNLFGGSGASSGSTFDTGGGFNVNLPGFANGTSFAPGGLALVGEKGPEIVNLPKGSQVTPNGQFGGTNIFNFTIQGQTDQRSQQQIADAAYRGVSRANRRNG